MSSRKPGRICPLVPSSGATSGRVQTRGHRDPVGRCLHARRSSPGKRASSSAWTQHRSCYSCSARLSPTPIPAMSRWAGRCFGNCPVRCRSFPSGSAWSIGYCPDAIFLRFNTFASPVSPHAFNERLAKRQINKVGFYQVSTKGRLFPSFGTTGGTERKPRISQRRVSRGSITSSISR